LSALLSKEKTAAPAPLKSSLDPHRLGLSAQAGAGAGIVQPALGLTIRPAGNFTIGHIAGIGRASRLEKCATAAPDKIQFTA
jgi:hypothetical protein